MQRALRTVTQHLRGANPIEGTCATTGYTTTYNTCVRFSVPRNESGFGGCARTEFVVGLIDDTNPADDERLLVYDRVEHNASDCGVGTFNVNNRQVLLARVINGTSEPLFRYYSAEGGLIDTATVAGATSVPDAATVSVHLRMRHRTTAKPIEMTSFASLRNNISR